MPDFPTVTADPQRSLISTWGKNCLAGETGLAQNLNASGGAVWPATNRAIYTAVWIEQLCTARRLAVSVVTQSGNLDMGIYDSIGKRIVSKGSTAVAATGTQIVDLTASVTGTASPVLTPGTYFLAMCVDNVTASFKSTGINVAEMCRVCGVQQEALGAVTLGATATFANPASAYMPVIGLGTAAVM